MICQAGDRRNTRPPTSPPPRAHLTYDMPYSCQMLGISAKLREPSPLLTDDDDGNPSQQPACGGDPRLSNRSIQLRDASQAPRIRSIGVMLRPIPGLDSPSRTCRMTPDGRKMRLPSPGTEDSPVRQEKKGGASRPALRKRAFFFLSVSRHRPGKFVQPPKLSVSPDWKILSKCRPGYYKR